MKRKKLLFSLMAMLLPLASWADGLTIEFDQSVIKEDMATFEYAGTLTDQKVKEAVKVYAGEGEDKTLLTEGQFVLYITYASNSSNPKIGTATVEAVGQGQAYSKLNATKECNITPKVVNTKFLFANVGNEGVSKVYGESDQAVLEQLVTLSEVQASLAAGDLDAEFADFLNCLEVARREGTSNSDYVNEEGYTVLVQGKSGEFESNYKYEKPKNGSYTTLYIEPRPLTVMLLDNDKKTEYTHRAYNSIPLYLETLVSGGRIAFAEAEEGKAEGVLETDAEKIKVEALNIVEINGEETEETQILNAGVYTLQPVLKDAEGLEKNYDVQLITFTMDKAAVTIKAAENATGLSNEYTGIAGEIVVPNTNFDFEGLKQTADVLNLIVKANIDGTASVKEEGYGFKLYQGEEEEAEEVAKVEGVYTSGNYTYTFDEGLTYMITPKSLGDGTNSYKDAKITGAVNDNVEFVYTGKDYAADGDEDEVKDKITVTYANKEATEEDEEEVEPKKLIPGEDYIIDVVGYNSNETSGKAINANEQFTIAVKGKGNYTGQYNITGNTIQKAELKISLKDDVKAETTFKKVADGVGSGNLAQYFEFTGLVDADKEQGEDEELLDYPKASVLTMKTTHSEESTAPGWMIQIWYNNINSPKATEESPVELKNYTVTGYETQYYTILPEIDFVLDRDAEDDAEAETQSVATLLDTYNGTSIKVQIKQVQTIKANTWTVLTLPFATNTRELCQAFKRYVVVDVPNLGASPAPNTVSFNLHTSGDIEANTLMLIKIDEDLNLNEDNVIFNLPDNERVIDYDPELAANREDGSQNKFVGLYATTEDLAGTKGGWFVSTTDGVGNFYSLETRTEPAYLKALQGYIVMKDSDPQKSTIYVGEPDGSTTAINAITGEAINNNAEGWYTVGGMKLDGVPTQKGVYINNGKKVVIK